MERRNSRSPESGMRYHNAAARSIAITINRASSQVQNLIGLENLTQGRPPQANFCQKMASLNDRGVVRRLKLTEVMEVEHFRISKREEVRAQSWWRSGSQAHSAVASYSSTASLKVRYVILDK